MNHQIIIQVFKPSGKLNSEKRKDLLPDEINEQYSLAIMFKISDRIREELGGYLLDGCILYVTVPDIGYPCILTTKNKPLDDVKMH